MKFIKNYATATEALNVVVETPAIIYQNDIKHLLHIPKSAGDTVTLSNTTEKINDTDVTIISYEQPAEDYSDIMKQINGSDDGVSTDKTANDLVDEING